MTLTTFVEEMFIFMVLLEAQIHFLCDLRELCGEKLF